MKKNQAKFYKEIRRHVDLTFMNRCLESFQATRGKVNEVARGYLPKTATFKRFANKKGFRPFAVSDLVLKFYFEELKKVIDSGNATNLSMNSFVSGYQDALGEWTKLKLKPIWKILEKKVPTGLSPEELSNELFDQVKKTNDKACVKALILFYEACWLPIPPEFNAYYSKIQAEVQSSGDEQAPNSNPVESSEPFETVDSPRLNPSFQREFLEHEFFKETKNHLAQISNGLRNLTSTIQSIDFSATTEPSTVLSGIEERLSHRIEVLVDQRIRATEDRASPVSQSKKEEYLVSLFSDLVLPPSDPSQIPGIGEAKKVAGALKLQLERRDLSLSDEQLAVLTGMLLTNQVIVLSKSFLRTWLDILGRPELITHAVADPMWSDFTGLSSIFGKLSRHKPVSILVLWGFDQAPIDCYLIPILTKLRLLREQASDFRILLVNSGAYCSDNKNLLNLATDLSFIQPLNSTDSGSSVLVPYDRSGIKNELLKKGSANSTVEKSVGKPIDPWILADVQSAQSIANEIVPGSAEKTGKLLREYRLLPYQVLETDEVSL